MIAESGTIHPNNAFKSTLVGQEECRSSFLPTSATACDASLSMWDIPAFNSDRFIRSEIVTSDLNTKRPFP